MIRYFSMFSGIGGFEYGIGTNGTCVGFSEIDKYAIQIYKKHFPSHIYCGDATKIKSNKLPFFDLLVGGFPDNWTEGISDTQRYKCLGNAVTTNVIKVIINKIISNIELMGLLK